MGEVFRAVDTRLGRQVAIKTCYQEFSERFNREARAISALNHPHICTLYDVGSNYLVMELVEGETLASRLGRGKLSMKQALEFGSQIADALAAAHAKGIIHRDLKPQNIMLTKSGVKVLDFGLAKSRQDDLTLTASHVVMGTPAYMAPEQREGKECLPESDIYSLGLILYEMAAGKRPPQDRPAELDVLPDKLAHIVERCLAAGVEERWHSARDLKMEMEWIGRGPTRASVAPTGSRFVWPVVVVSLVVAVTAVLWGFLHRPPRVLNQLPLRLAITAPQGADIREGVAISPDGRSVVFVAYSSGAERLWLRSLDSLNARELPGTEAASFPFWSPDSRFVAFFAGGKLKRIDVNSGVSAAICDIGLGRGGAWNEQGTILFNSVNDGPLLKVGAGGGPPAPITMLDTARQENSHRFPHFLPDGRRFLYFVRAPQPEVAGVYLGSLDHPQEKIRLQSASTNAVFVPSADGGSNHLAWVENGNLMVRAFDPVRAEMSGEAIALASDVRFNAAGRYAQLSASKDGLLVYGTAARAQQKLTWFSRDGKALDTIGQADAYNGMRISPDETRIAISYERTSSHSAGIASLETERGIATPLVTAFWGAWSPDGQRIAYSGSPSGAPNIYVIATTGHGDPERLTNSANTQIVVDWSPDGRFIIYAEQPNDVSAPTKSGLWILPLADRKPILFVQTAYQQAHAQFSPDTQWVAYTSTESGRAEIGVQSFPAGRAKWRISSNGGDYPRWRKDGRELFYLAPDQTLMSVAVQRSAGLLEFGPPTPLFKIPVATRGAASAIDYPFDVASNGQRILGLNPSGDGEVQSLIVLSNWQIQMPAMPRN
jgi:Tol biopolymer transport system component